MNSPCVCPKTSGNVRQEKILARVTELGNLPAKGICGINPNPADKTADASEQNSLDSNDQIGFNNRFGIIHKDYS